MFPSHRENVSSDSESLDDEVDLSVQGRNQSHSNQPMTNGNAKRGKVHLDRSDPQEGISDKSLEETTTPLLGEYLNQEESMSDEMLEEMSTSSLSDEEDQEMADGVPTVDGKAIEKEFLQRISEISDVLESQYKERNEPVGSSMNSSCTSGQSGRTIENTPTTEGLNGEVHTDSKDVLHMGLNGSLDLSEDKHEEGNHHPSVQKEESRTEKAKNKTKHNKRMRENAGSSIVENSGGSQSRPSTCENGNVSRETKSILKVNGRQSGVEKKNVTWKKGEDLAKVVGVASGVGFDSVAVPNMAALMAMSMGQESVQGRRGARGKGRGRGSSMNMFENRQKKGQVRGRGKGRGRGGKRRKSS